MTTHGLYVAAISLLLVSGCTTKQYRFVGSNTSPAFEGVSADHPYRLSFIEFDERGDYWDREQIRDASRKIKAPGKPLLLVVFIHGWHNDASDKSGDVDRFRCLLKQLGNGKATSQLIVHGVYIGWRGESVARATFPASTVLWPAKQLSLYSRKSAAERAAGHPMADAVFWVVREARKYKPGSRTVLVGHSLGALVLEKILAQSLPARLYTYDANDRVNSGSALYAPADLVLLLNSAAESLYAKELIDTFRRIPQQPGSGTNIDPQHPLLVSITSKADWATGTFFPIGTGLSNAFGVSRDYTLDQKLDGSSAKISQKHYLTHTAAHNTNVATHEIILRNPPVRMPAGAWDKQVLKCAVEENPSFEENLDHPRKMGFVTGQRGNWDQWEIRETLGNGKATPYWVLKVPKELIPSHGDVFNPNARSMMAALFRLINSVTPGPPRKMPIMHEERLAGSRRFP